MILTNKRQALTNTFLLSSDYQWRVRGEEVAEAAGRSELVLEAARELDGVTVTCRAANQAGENWADTELHVNCKVLFDKDHRKDL